MEVHHLQECPKLPHSCKFAAVGCERKILIGDIENHFNESKDTHLTLALERIVSQNEELKQHKIENRNQQLEITSLNTKLEAVMQRLEKTEKKLNITNFTDEFVLKIQNFAENFSTGKKIRTSFYTSRRYRLAVWTPPKGAKESVSDHMSVFIRVTSGHFDDNIQWPFKANIEFSVLSKSKKTFHHSIRHHQPNF
ncbi:TNF receptor-associated factor 6-like [Clytia hemisphaerica]|uniref:MATH domain-containing protein n=1 Tax=Clytia hemisphaerica TaxID=252671 RepID=A0A7M5V5J2_9CNID